jgi:hypothetical protein
MLEVDRIKFASGFFEGKARGNNQNPNLKERTLNALML